MKRTKRIARRRRLRRQSRGGNPRSRRTRQTTSIGTTLASAARSLIGLLPGSSALKTIADFGYNILTTITKYDHDQLAMMGSVRGTNIYGLGCCIYPTMAACLRDCPLLTRDSTGATLHTNFLDGRLRSFTVTVEPTNIISKRSGNWALLFTPYRDAGDHEKYKNEKTTPSVPCLMRHPGVVADRADRSLTLTFQPRVEDGYCGLYMGLAVPFGMICLAYQEENRDFYNKFTAEEFSCRVRVSASVTLRSATILSTSSDVSTGFPDSTPVSNSVISIMDCKGVMKDYSYSEFVDLGGEAEVRGLRRISPMDC